MVMRRGAATAAGRVALLWLLTGARAALGAADDCAPPPPPPEAGSGPLLWSGVNASERALVLRVHNTLRERVASGDEQRGQPGPQPPAADMNALVWDEELADRAQRWADRRVFQHNPCRSSKNHTYIGENLAIQYVSGEPPENFGWPKAVEDWYNEVTLWPNDLVNKYKFRPETGHYTQVVWAATRLVGCGASAFQQGKMKATLFVCNYAPGGNVVGASLYTPGTPRSACSTAKRPKRRLRKFPSLCAP